MEADRQIAEIMEIVKKQNADLQQKWLEEGYEKAKLVEKISILLSCKNCRDNKGGLICQKEYEDKCLTQKIQYIKELKDENKELEEENAKLQAKIDDWQSEYIELENLKNNEIAELKDKLNNLSSVAEVRLANWRKYEKENAELKEKLEIEQNARGDWFGKAVTKDRRLTEAKELIRNIIRVTWGEGWNYDLEWKVKAEQFIKE